MLWCFCSLTLCEIGAVLAMTEINNNIPLSSKDTALILGKSEAQLSNMRQGKYADERLKFTKDGGTYYYYSDDVRAYVKESLSDAMQLFNNQLEMLALKIKQASKGGTDGV